MMARHNRCCTDTVRAASVCFVGGFNMGWCIVVINGAVIPIQHEFNLDSTRAALPVSILVLGAMVGSGIGGRIVDVLGRRVGLLVAALAYMLGSLLMLWAPIASEAGFVTLVAGRATVGIAVGVGGLAGPVYLSEVMPEHLRGQSVTAVELFVCGGALLALVVNLLLVQSPWRWQLGLISLGPAILQAVLAIQAPESATWLAAVAQGEPEYRPPPTPPPAAAERSSASLLAAFSAAEEARVSASHGHESTDGGGPRVIDEYDSESDVGSPVRHSPHRSSLPTASSTACGLAMWQRPASQLSGKGSISHPQLPSQAPPSPPSPHLKAILKASQSSDQLGASGLWGSWQLARHSERARRVRLRAQVAGPSPSSTIIQSLPSFSSLDLLPPLDDEDDGEAAPASTALELHSTSLSAACHSPSADAAAPLSSRRLLEPSLRSPLHSPLRQPIQTIAETSAEIEDALPRRRGDGTSASTPAAAHERLHADVAAHSGGGLVATPLLAALGSARHRVPILAALAVPTLHNLLLTFALQGFATTLLVDAGIGHPQRFAILVGVMKMLGVIVCVALVEGLGRKPLLLVGAAGIGGCYGLVGVGFALKRPLLITAPFVSSFFFWNASWAPLIWTVASELLHPAMRPRVMGVSAVLFWTTSFTITSAVLPILEALGHVVGFALFASIALGVGGFVWLCVPESKGYAQLHYEHGRSSAG